MTNEKPKPLDERVYWCDFLDRCSDGKEQDFKCRAGYLCCAKYYEFDEEFISYGKPTN